MPNLPSGWKRMRQSRVRRARNVAVTGSIHTAQRKLSAALEGKQKDVAEKAYRAYASLLDKAAKTGVIHANNAARRKSRATARLAKLSA